MDKIYKYAFEVAGQFPLILPIRAEILTVQVQKGRPVIWAIVDTAEEKTEEREFRIIGTGHDISDNLKTLKYIGTFQLKEGSFIGHLFEKVGKSK